MAIIARKTDDAVEYHYRAALEEGTVQCVSRGAQNRAIFRLGARSTAAIES